jgi:tRNA(adenine34) deaminase
MHRRDLLTGGGTLLIAATLAPDARARSEKVAATPDDARYMELAIKQAKIGDYPFGAVIVRDSKVLALGHNSTRRNSDPTAHAEMMAIRAFLTGHEPEDFKSTTIYSSGEPCPMCMGAIIWCGFKRLVYAASIGQLATRIGQIDVTGRDLANAASFANIAITGGVLSADAMALFDKAEPKDKR